MLSASNQYSRNVKTLEICVNYELPSLVYKFIRADIILSYRIYRRMELTSAVVTAIFLSGYKSAVDSIGPRKTSTIVENKKYVISAGSFDRRSVQNARRLALIVPRETTNAQQYKTFTTSSSNKSCCPCCYCEQMRIKYTPSKHQGTFYTPNFPDKYPQKINCLAYTFEGASTHLVEMTFLEFDLPGPSSHSSTIIGRSMNPVTKNNKKPTTKRKTSERDSQNPHICIYSNGISDQSLGFKFREYFNFSKDAN
ncbi:hypothetical protein HELRODRAFT_167751 [Helobdella robusta]|uniref:CUB domain-containing protein n=1 Tax=Helobdella robusta TaxID=6412 RepID=T1EZR3_HELRO|nr:hypothetical protein HELRODRAFT_167751 [Helobdella robusta]ESO09926.1 hypothetical protein HELRODRAFT_167751 [Helobdella robusta]